MFWEEIQARQGKPDVENRQTTIANMLASYQVRLEAPPKEETEEEQIKRTLRNTKRVNEREEKLGIEITKEIKDEDYFNLKDARTIKATKKKTTPRRPPTPRGMEQTHPGACGPHAVSPAGPAWPAAKSTSNIRSCMSILFRWY